jgi:putative phosphoribosyl transferase
VIAVEAAHGRQIDGRTETHERRKRVTNATGDTNRGYGQHQCKEWAARMPSMPTTSFVDRADAGRQLAILLTEYQKSDVVVLALPRGGVPVGFEIAQFLGKPLDVLIVRKLGAPGQPEFALGAIASGGVVVVNEDALRWFRDSPAFEAVIATERDELERREQVYREGRAAQPIKDRTVILADDGAATGSSMQAAVRAVRKLGAREILVALPVASSRAWEKLSRDADRLVCIHVREAFAGISQWYENFTQITDDEVRDLLGRASQKSDRWVSQRN